MVITLTFVNCDGDSVSGDRLDLRVSSLSCVASELISVRLLRLDHDGRTVEMKRESVGIEQAAEEFWRGELRKVD
jgi:hypothetical protein